MRAQLQKSYSFISYSLFLNQKNVFSIYPYLLRSAPHNSFFGSANQITAKKGASKISKRKGANSLDKFSQRKEPAPHKRRSSKIKFFCKRR
jgi:hypothetical protein